MTRSLLALSGVLLVGSLGAFFLFVPPLLIATMLMGTVTLLLTGFLLLFWRASR